MYYYSTSTDINTIGYKIMNNDKVMNMVASVVCSELNVTIEEIRSAYRGRTVAEARQVFAYICDKYYRFRLTEIGKFMNRDHSTVIHSSKQAVLPHMTDYVTRVKHRLNIV